MLAGLPYISSNIPFSFKNRPALTPARKKQFSLIIILKSFLP